MRLFHASPRSDLARVGLRPLSQPHVSITPSEWVYLGTRRYVMEHYLPDAKQGIYYLYEVDVTDMQIDDNLPGEQVKTCEHVDPDRIVIVDIIENFPVRHPREFEYAMWHASMSNDPFVSAMHKAAVLAEATADMSVASMRQQVSDIDDSIRRLSTYRDRCPRGSARRADFAASIRRLRDWQGKLVKKIERATRAKSKSNK
jgi:hypothetical protein